MVKLLFETHPERIAMENIEARKWKGKSKKRKTRRKLRLSSAISFSLGQYVGPKENEEAQNH